MSGSYGSSSTKAQNYQNPDYTALSGDIASKLKSLFSGDWGAFGQSPYTVNGVSSKDTAQNPLVAGMTGNESSLLNNIQDFTQGGGQGLSGAQGMLARFLDPNYAASLASSPQTQQAISAATNPMINAFKQTTAPGIAGNFTAAGQRTGTSTGSSAFDMATNAAQNNLLGQVGAVSGGIANSAYQTGLQQQSGAVGQSIGMSQVELNNMVQSLQAEALPRMIQQYGINQGLQLFQTQISSIMQALGLGGQLSEPSLGYNSQGSSYGFNSGLSWKS